jgi:membrane-associated phospholipid phosphatase
MPKMLIPFGLIFLFTTSVYSYTPPSLTSAVTNKSSLIFPAENNKPEFHKDSIHNFNFRYADKKRGLRPWIAPALLTASGTALHFMPEVKGDIHDFMHSNLSYQGSIDDYAKIAPLAAVYLLNLTGIRGKNNFGNLTALVVKSILVNNFATYRLKVWVNATRPNFEKHSFPSGHTSMTFTFAHFMHKEYGDRSPWYSIGAYSGATAVGVMRIAKNAHWLSDVLAGAGIGILSTELVYLTHQYKWDNEHIKRLDIFPFRMGRQNGLTMIYSF